MNRHLRGVVSLAAVAFALISSGANAATISIGWRQDGGAITTVAGSGVSDNFSAPVIGTPNFSISVASGLTQPSLPSPGLLFSNNTDVTSALDAVSHSLDVFITAQGLTTPTGLLNFISGLTENTIVGGLTATLSTFVSSTNALFGGTALSSATFSTTGSATLNANANTGAGPYSVTAQYHIVTTAGTAGAANSTINITGVPGPVVGAGLPGLLAACFALAALARRRRATQV